MIARLAAVALLCAGASLATGSEQDDAAYRAMVERVKSGDFSVDFHALRLACLKSDLCEPRATKADLGAFIEAERMHQFDKVVEIGNRLIDRGFVNLEVHATLAGVYRQMHEEEKAKFHLSVVTGLLGSILQRGDGKTTATAYQVISDREVYFTLSGLNLPYSGPSVSTLPVTEDGRHYDKWDVVDPKTGKRVTLYFNVDLLTAPKTRVSSK